MTFKHRLLVAVLMTLIAIGYQVALAQTKTVKKNFVVMNEAVCNCNVLLKPVITNPTACNLTNGSVVLDVSGGAGPLTYQWKDPAGQIISTGKDLTNVGTGYYFLEVKDTNAPSCGTYYSNYTLSSNLNVTTTIKDNVGCVTANGAISITATGGSGNYTYAWRLPDGAEVTTKNITGAKAGSYYLTLKDATLGCTITRSVAIKSNAQLSVTTNAITENTSCDTPDGGISISAGSGSGQYAYTWYDMRTYGVTSHVQNMTNVRGGDYTAFIIDKISGCIAYQYLSVGDNTTAPSFSVAEIISNTNCKAPFNGSARLDINGTPGPYQVEWLTESGVVSSERDLTATSAGAFGFIITDTGTKCKTRVQPSDSIVNILDESKPYITLITSDIKPNTNCITSNGKIAVSIANPTTPFSYSWTGTNGFSSDKEVLTGLAPGTYELTIEAACNNPPVIEAPPVTASHSLVSFELNEIITDPDDNLDVTSIVILDQPNSLAKAAILENEKLTIDYTGIRFKGTDKLRIKACDLLNACTENLITIEVQESGGLIVYNAVAPHSTGDNKFMRIDNLPENNRVFIFNRWGDVVFKVDRYNSQEPGRRFEGMAMSGKSLPSGTYLYKIEVPGNAQPVTGYLSLKQ